MGERDNVATKSADEVAEERPGMPPVKERGLENENPPESSVWQRLEDDIETHESKLFAQGFWASRATFSAKVSNIREDREAALSRLVYRGPRLFVRREANVVMNEVKAPQSGHSTNDQAGSEHMNGESR
jgi:hypothetical protein